MMQKPTLSQQYVDV